MTKVAFCIFGDRYSNGGNNYMLNLWHVLREYGEKGVTPILFVGLDFPETKLMPFIATGYEVVRSPIFDGGGWRRFIGALLTGKDWELERLFLEYKVDVAFETAAFFGWRFAIPTIAWIPDFQHRHLKHMFSFLEYWRREIGFKVQMVSGRTILLSSEDARQDCERFYPSSRGHTHVVSFAVRVDKTGFDSNPESVRIRYGLPATFIYLPNRFWKHKNHIAVIQALAMLKYLDVVIAVTGEPLDPRHLDYFSELLELVERNGLVNNFRVLGVIPYSDVVALMRASAAVLNPSYFEGWSTTVEEAKALGVPLILSSLGVHREQMGEAAMFFSPSSPEELAGAIRNFYSHLPEATWQHREEKALQAMPERLRVFAQNFERAIEATCLAPQLTGLG